jgi:hypothetical protein
MRRLRANKRRGLKCHRVRLTTTEIATMIREGVATGFGAAAVQNGIEAIVADWIIRRSAKRLPHDNFFRQPTCERAGALRTSHWSRRRRDDVTAVETDDISRHEGG